MVMIFTGQIYQYFLWLEKSPLTYLINKEDEINEDGGHIVSFITWKNVKKGGKIWENNKKGSLFIGYSRVAMKTTGKFGTFFSHKSKYW